MKPIVISPEHEDPREVAVLGDLFAAGLERYHVRKPTWSREKLEAWLRALPREWRPRLVLHTHHALVASLALGGAHERDKPGRAIVAERLPVPRGAGSGSATAAIGFAPRSANGR